MIKILAIGDVFGEVGKKILVNYLSKIKIKYFVDFTIANVENSSKSGKSITEKDFHLFKSLGIDVMTSGNHIFSLEETRNYIQKYPELLRPLNSNPYHPGNGTYLTSVKGKTIRVTNLIGNAFMPTSENPYFALEKVFNEEESEIHIVDFHAEATAEKRALSWYFDGKLTAFYGTHTHVQTADERILPNGTAFITDIGMTGPKEGIIGAKPEAIIKRGKFGFNSKMEPNYDSGQFNGIVISIEEKGNKVLLIERLNFDYEYLEKFL
ncbi:MAG TPA: TIGR00282 family metallophosphoesterase [Mycoplasmatales bacterium]|nr:TIGR00282 family metallophosphoesterase [Mycoplasmatales bacterium]